MLKFRELYLAVGLMLAFGVISLALALPHPGGGAVADITGINDASATTWNVGTKNLLPLVVGGAILGGVGGAMTRISGGVGYGALAGGGVVGITAAYGPSIVTTIVAATNAAGADTTTIAWRTSGGWGTDPAIWLAIAVGLAGVSLLRRYRYGSIMPNRNR